MQKFTRSTACTGENSVGTGACDMGQGLGRLLKSGISHLRARDEEEVLRP